MQCANRMGYKWMPMCLAPAAITLDGVAGERGQVQQQNWCPVRWIRHSLSLARPSVTLFSECSNKRYIYRFPICVISCCLFVYLFITTSINYVSYSYVFFHFFSFALLRFLLLTLFLKGNLILWNLLKLIVFIYFIFLFSICIFFCCCLELLGEQYLKHLSTS